MTWNTRLTPRQEADAIEQFAEDLAKLLKAFDRTCDRMTFDAAARMSRIPCADELDGIAAAFAKLGQAMHNECDEAEEADDRRRANPLEPRAPYPFCRTPDQCAGKGYCPKEFACND